MIAKFFDALIPFAPLVLRIGLGVAFTFHGAQKVFGIWDGKGVDAMAENVAGMGFPFPVFFAWAAALSEFAGGIMVFFGLFTRFAAFFQVITMCVAFFGVHHASFLQHADGAFLYGMAALALVFGGGGKCAIDNLIFKHKKA